MWMYVCLAFGPYYRVEVLDKNSPSRALEGLISTKADKLSALVAFVETKERQCSGEYPQGTLSSSLASGIWDFVS
jgi:hypothetical protein